MNRGNNASGTFIAGIRNHKGHSCSQPSTDRPKMSSGYQRAVIWKLHMGNPETWQHLIYISSPDIRAARPLHVFLGENGNETVPNGP
jgi:hypothetical protein